MDALQVAATFTAFTCYLNATSPEPRSPEEAGRLARENWRNFLPFVDQDLARFLTARPPARKSRAAANAHLAKKRSELRYAV